MFLYHAGLHSPCEGVRSRFSVRSIFAGVGKSSVVCRPLSRSCSCVVGGGVRISARCTKVHAVGSVPAFVCADSPCALCIRYLVDPASSHMLVSKIKPCMSKYKPQFGETANGSLNHT